MIDDGVGASRGGTAPRPRGSRTRPLYILIELVAVCSTVAAVMWIGAMTARLFIGPLGIVAAVIVIRLSLWLQGRDLGVFGLGRPDSWWRTIVQGIVAWLVVSVGNGLLINPVIFRLLGETPRLQVFEGLRGHTAFYLQLLTLSWTIAAFGEEILFRGYLYGRIAELLGRAPGGRLFALLAQAAAFGCAHLYQGMAGVLVTGSVGIVLGLLYLWARRNLWVVVLAHGLVDTVSLTVLYLGLDQLIRDGL